MNIIENPNAYNGRLAYTPDKQYERMANATIENPDKVTNLYSPSHYNAIGQFNDPQSRNNIIDVSWEKAEDQHSGTEGYFVKWDDQPNTIPTFTDPSLGPDTTCAISEELPDGMNYFHIITIDHAGNWDEEGEGQACTKHLGPIFIKKSHLKITCTASPSKFEVTTVGKGADDPTVPNSTTITMTIEDCVGDIPFIWDGDYYAKEIKCVIGSASYSTKTFMNNGTIQLSWSPARKSFIGSRSWSWSGTTDAGGKVGPGTYKIYAEAKDPAGNKGDNSEYYDTVSADPTFVQQSRKPEVTVIAASPSAQYQYYNYPAPKEISLNPASSDDISIYRDNAETDRDAEIMIQPEAGSLTLEGDGVIVTMNNTDAVDAKTQLISAQYNTELSIYDETIKSQVGAEITIATQSYIDVGAGLAL